MQDQLFHFQFAEWKHLFPIYPPFIPPCETLLEKWQTACRYSQLRCLKQFRKRDSMFFVERESSEWREWFRFPSNSPFPFVCLLILGDLYENGLPHTGVLGTKPEGEKNNHQKVTHNSFSSGVSVFCSNSNYVGKFYKTLNSNYSTVGAQQNTPWQIDGTKMNESHGH